MKCPVCGKYEFEEYSSYDICPFCKWEDDGLQGDDHNYAGGANHLSVNEARIEYFLLNYPPTREKAKKLYDNYSKSIISIIHKYDGLDHVEESLRAEQETLDYREARKNYVDLLNELHSEVLRI